MITWNNQAWVELFYLNLFSLHKQLMCITASLSKLMILRVGCSRHPHGLPFGQIHPSSALNWCLSWPCLPPTAQPACLLPSAQLYEQGVPRLHPSLLICLQQGSWRWEEAAGQNSLLPSSDWLSCFAISSRVSCLIIKKLGLGQINPQQISLTSSSGCGVTLRLSQGAGLQKPWWDPISPL